MKHIVYSVLVVLLATTSCTESRQIKESNHVEQISVNLETSSALKLSKLLTDAKIIPLQTTDKTIIGEVLGIKKYNNELYIKSSGSIRVFDESGKFLRKIGTIGKGANEILAVTNFYVDTIKKIVEVYDGVRSQNILYNLEGKALKTIKHSYRHGYDFIKDKKGGYFFYLGFGADKMGELIYVPNLTKKSHQDLLQYNAKLAKYLHFGDLVNFASNKYGIHFTRSFNNYVYKVGDGGIIPKYEINFGNKNLPNSLLYDEYRDVRDFMMTCSATEYAFRIIGFYELKNWIIFGFHYKNKIWNTFFSKKTKECSVVSYYIDDFFGTKGHVESSFDLLPKGFTNEEIFICIDAYKVREFIDAFRASKNTEAGKLLDKIKFLGLDKLKAGDNPVIIQLKLK